MNPIASSLLLPLLLIGCTNERDVGEVPRVGNAGPVADGDLIRGDESLFPLSTYFGVCAKNPPTLRAELDSGMPARHYATIAIITVESGELILNVGKFQADPNINWSDVSPEAAGRHIQEGAQGGSRHLLVTKFERTAQNMVSIQYDAGSSELHKSALELANNVVACQLVSPSR